MFLKKVSAATIEKGLVLTKKITATVTQEQYALIGKYLASLGVILDKSNSKFVDKSFYRGAARPAYYELSLKLLEGSFDTALKIFDLQNIAIKTFNKIKVDADKNTTGTFRGLSVDLQSPEWEEVKPSSKQVYRGQVVGG